MGGAGDGRDDNIKSGKGNDENVGIVLVFTALGRNDKINSGQSNDQLTGGVIRTNSNVAVVTT